MFFIYSYSIICHIWRICWNIGMSIRNKYKRYAQGLRGKAAARKSWNYRRCIYTIPESKCKHKAFFNKKPFWQKIISSEHILHKKALLHISQLSFDIRVCFVIIYNTKRAWWFRSLWRNARDVNAFEQITLSLILSTGWFKSRVFP
jgi:hypothetical protein